MQWDNMTKHQNDGGIGFRDMRIFNQALLATQDWRSVHRRDNLCGRVFKSKYFWKGNLLDTVSSLETSSVQEGIEFGFEPLKKGIIWRVGNGRSIHIMRDNQLPWQPGLSVISLKGRTRIRWVNPLISSVTNGWNKPLIESLFHSFDAEEILKINLPSSNGGPCPMEF